MIDVISASMARRSVAEYSHSARAGAPVAQARRSPAAQAPAAPVRRSLATALRWSADRLAPAR